MPLTLAAIPLSCAQYGLSRAVPYRTVKEVLIYAPEPG